MNASTGSLHPGVQVATQAAPGAGGQAAQPPDGIATRFAMTESSLTALLQKLASQQPNRTAYTFIDYEVDRRALLKASPGRRSTGER